MDMVRHHTQFDYNIVMPFTYIMVDVIANLVIFLASKHLVSELEVMLKVIDILAYAIAVTNLIHNF